MAQFEGRGGLSRGDVPLPLPCDPDDSKTISVTGPSRSTPLCPPFLCLVSFSGGKWSVEPFPTVLDPFPQPTTLTPHTQARAATQAVHHAQELHVMPGASLDLAETSDLWALELRGSV